MRTSPRASSTCSTATAPAPPSSASASGCGRSRRSRPRSPAAGTGWRTTPRPTPTSSPAIRRRPCGGRLKARRRPSPAPPAARRGSSAPRPACATRSSTGCSTAPACASSPGPAAASTPWSGTPVASPAASSPASPRATSSSSTTAPSPAATAAIPWSWRSSPGCSTRWRRGGCGRWRSRRTFRRPPVEVAERAAHQGPARPPLPAAHGGDLAARAGDRRGAGGVHRLHPPLRAPPGPVHPLRPAVPGQPGPRLPRLPRQPAGGLAVPHDGRAGDRAPAARRELPAHPPARPAGAGLAAGGDRPHARHRGDRGPGGGSPGRLHPVDGAQAAVEPRDRGPARRGGPPLPRHRPPALGVRARQAPARPPLLQPPAPGLPACRVAAAGPRLRARDRLRPDSRLPRPPQPRDQPSLIAASTAAPHLPRHRRPPEDRRRRPPRPGGRRADRHRGSARPGHPELARAPHRRRHPDPRRPPLPPPRRPGRPPRQGGRGPRARRRPPHARGRRRRRLALRRRPSPGALLLAAARPPAPALPLPQRRRVAAAARRARPRRGRPAHGHGHPLRQRAAGGAARSAALNLVWGAATVALATFLFALAWRAHRRGDDRRAILALLAAGLALRLYAGADLFLHTWDERYHALVAKHLLAHPATPTLYDRPLLPYDYRDWRANHVWLHKPPLALWLMAAGLGLGRAVAGAQGAELAMRLPGLLLSTAV